MDLLFELATWHALAKLHLHTESTVIALENSTTRLGIALRKFQSTICAEFETRDLPSEEAARGRRKAAKVKVKPPMPSKEKGKGRNQHGGRSISHATNHTHWGITQRLSGSLERLMAIVPRSYVFLNIFFISTTNYQNLNYLGRARTSSL